MRPSTIASLLLVTFYIAFWCWYTPLRGPLKPDEVSHYLSLMEDQGTDQEGQQRLRRFLESDDGNDFVMLNVIELNDQPTPMDGVDPADSSADVLGKYMEYMWPALIRRASHPVLFGSAAGEALETWGIDVDRKWSTGAAMRYRSRRDLMEITTNPEFQGRHGFKLAAMHKTVAFPVDPWTSFVGGPRLLLGLIVAILLLLLRRPPGLRRPKLELAGRLR